MKKTLLLSGLGLGLLGTGVASADEVYTVVSGDTVSLIAQKFNTTVEKIDEKNNLKDIDMIYVGQKLTIPTLKTSTTHYSTITQTPVATTTPTSQIQTDVNQPNNHDMGYNVKPQATQTQVKPVIKQQANPTQIAQSSSGGSVKDRVIRTAMSQGVSRSTAELMWTHIVMPESGGNPNASNGGKYLGLYQASASYGWGQGSVESQTRGAINYAKRFGGSTPEQNMQNAVNARKNQGWW